MYIPPFLHKRIDSRGATEETENCLSSSVSSVAPCAIPSVAAHPNARLIARGFAVPLSQVPRGSQTECLYPHPLPPTLGERLFHPLPTPPLPKATMSNSGRTPSPQEIAILQALGVPDTGLAADRVLIYDQAAHL